MLVYHNQIVTDFHFLRTYIVAHPQTNKIAIDQLTQLIGHQKENQLIHQNHYE